MPAKQDPNLNLNYGWDARESGWNTGMDANLVRLGALMMLSVKSMDQTAAPGTPSEGERYIVAEGGTGAFSGKDKQVARYRQGAWEFFIAQEGWIAWAEDVQKPYRYRGGNWMVESIDLPSPVADTYLRRNATNDAYVAKTPTEVANELSPLIAPQTADTYLRRNTANSAYEAKTPLQVADELIGVRDWRGRNVLINGDFRVWQEGTSFSIGGVTVLTAEMWKVGAGITGTASRQAFTLGQTDVPGEPQYFHRVDVTTAATVSNSPAYQRIEGVRTLAGQVATVSFWAKCGSGTKVLTPRLAQVFGTGGTPSAAVTTELSSITLTTSWQKFVRTVQIPGLSGKTLGTNNDDFLQVDLSEMSGFSTYTVDLSDIQLEPGSVATPFERKPIGEVLALCQRYFQVHKALRFWKDHTQYWRDTIVLPVEMRTDPTVVFTQNKVGAVDPATVNFMTVTANSIALRHDSSEATGDVSIGITANARL